MLRQLKKLLPTDSRLRKWWHRTKAMAATVFYGFPARRLVCIGITGTNGKTTTVTLTAKILEKAGYRVGVASTVFFKVGNREWQNNTHMTSLTPFALQRLLRRMVNAGCTHAVLEVSSHSLAQQRTWGISFDVAAITNITPEHLDYHVSMKRYRSEKAKLFSSLILSARKHGTPKVVILNADDSDSLGDLVQFSADRKIAYSMRNKVHPMVTEYVRAADIQCFADFTDMVLSAGHELKHVRLYLSGAFNVENLLCSTAIASGLGIGLDAVERACREVRLVPGRMESVDLGQSFKVFVDFAMTEDGYVRMLSTLRQTTQGKLWVVFGCCGDRDKGKRRVIGEICGRMADRVVVCDDEPWTEEPQLIRRMILDGLAQTPLVKDEGYWEIPDRREALRFAFHHAGPGDTVVIPGMGDFEGRTFADGVRPWSEREVVRELLGELRQDLRPSHENTL